jgi:hypothetical protein
MTAVPCPLVLVLISMLPVELLLRSFIPSLIMFETRALRGWQRGRHESFGGRLSGE